MRYTLALDIYDYHRMPDLLTPLPSPEIHRPVVLQDEQLRVAIAMSLQESIPMPAKEAENGGGQGAAERAWRGGLAAPADDQMASGGNGDCSDVTAATKRGAEPEESAQACTDQSAGGGGAGGCTARDICASATGVEGNSGRGGSLIGVGGIGGLVHGVTSSRDDPAAAGEVGDLQPQNPRAPEEASDTGPNEQPGGGAAEEAGLEGGGR